LEVNYILYITLYNENIKKVQHEMTSEIQIDQFAKAFVQDKHNEPIIMIIIIKTTISIAP
jgi:non-homologous end joining protein Ku